MIERVSEDMVLAEGGTTGKMARSEDSLAARVRPMHWASYRSLLASPRSPKSIAGPKWSL